ncbi:putative phiE125 gp8 family phage protein [Sphingopyxis panaciterrae]|uniref:head-tail connector protein n=1 Tax=Sphingopyxis panaciterrae TaxID=363841 RepID=UPI00141F97FD|nr:hypothetical protein [Sphingopyxis panaciterrae]NIJ39320.1 putative phiE125 gp8 family phage protein [Sphingopyxis panaciterrae]
MTMSLEPGEAPVTLDEARGWLRLGASIDDAVVAGLIRAAANICESFVGQWLMIRSAEDAVPIRSGEIRLAVRPVIGVDDVTLLSGAGDESVVADGDWRLRIASDGRGWVSIDEAGASVQVRVRYRAGMAADANGIPEAIRHGILRMMQHLHDARDGGGGAGGTPPAMIAALWQPWRRIGLAR